jgi:hypothetical protein
MSSYSFSPAEYPCAQLLPAPPPSWDMKMFSGLYKFANGDVNMLLMTCQGVHAFPFQTVMMDISVGKTHPWLEVNENCTGYIMFIIRLIEKHVFTVATLCRPVLEDALFVDAMLSAKLLPEDGAHCKTPMSVVKSS